MNELAKFRVLDLKLREFLEASRKKPERCFPNACDPHEI